jgi:cytoskeletal protein CcmA (bactofilin family)
MTEQEMVEKQWQVVKWIEKMEMSSIAHQWDKYEKDEEKKLLRINKKNEDDRQALTAIKELIDGGIDLNFKQKPVLERAVATDNIELLDMLMVAGFPINEENRRGLLSCAAVAGAETVVRYLIEVKGANPRKKSPRDFSVLTSARSRNSRDVLPYLLSLMLKTKSERLPPPKKLHELTEENMLKWLPQVSLPAHSNKKLHDIVESLFVEEYSVKLSDFYEMIEVQTPEIVFASIALITNAITSAPTDKVVKSISRQPHLHHGNLEVTGNLKIRSLMVTGNLTVKGHASNVQGCQLFVGGDLECETMYTEGPVVIGGNLRAKKVDTYYNDYALDVKQTLQADTLIIDHHQVTAGHFDVKERIEK